jgi:two-component system NtrC family sensor kinase
MRAGSTRLSVTAVTVPRQDVVIDDTMSRSLIAFAAMRLTWLRQRSESTADSILIIDDGPDMRMLLRNRTGGSRQGDGLPERSVTPGVIQGNTMGLKLRLILVLIIPPILVVGVYGLIRVRTGRAELVAETERNVIVLAKAIEPTVERSLRDPRTSDLHGMLSDIVEDQEQIDRIRILDRELQLTAMSGRLSVTHDVPAELLRRVAETGQGEVFSARWGKTQIFSYILAIHTAGGAVVGTMEVSHQTSKIEDRVREATWDIAVRLTLLAISMTLLTGLVLQRQVLRPLSHLMEGIRNLGRGESAKPLPVERRDELGRVAEAFNTMATQLQAARRELLLETEHTLDLEQQLRHSATLAVAGRLASGVAHEIGTPLNIISGQVEYIFQNLPAGNALGEELNVIVEQIDRISAMIRSLLDTVRPVKPEIQPIVLKDVTDRLLLLLEHTARRHGVTLDVSIPGDLPPVRADRSQLQQVVINILMNAFEAARPSGNVQVRAWRAAHGSRAGVEIEVRDTGPGIHASLLPRIFEPFFSTKPPGEGTGLGLPISRDILKSLGGEITVKSAPGAGTSFLIWLAEDGSPEP